MKFVISLLSAFALHAQSVDVNKTLEGIENRYNNARSLELQFAESYTFKGRTRSESGTLYLRKPGRMRWQYVQPPGKLFISDGQFFYYYTPQDHRAEKMKLKEADDLRAPLAFLLGKLNFREDFREFHSSPKGPDLLITAVPKSSKLPYSEVTFLASPDFAIKQLQVRGQDGSVIEYSFDGEKKNPAVAEKMFRFTPPAGVEWIDSTR
jgi:outer membrane lipoprotein carrier protein